MQKQQGKANAAGDLHNAVDKGEERVAHAVEDAPAGIDRAEEEIEVAIAENC